MEELSKILGSRTRAEVFRLLFESGGVELYLREVQRQSGLSVRPIQVELKRLSDIGLVKTRVDGNRLYFRANTEHPLFPEVHKLVEKSVGAPALLRLALRDPDVKLAFIFGSVASGKAKPESDLDLLVIGSLGLRKLSKLLSGTSDRIGREINPHVMEPHEFARRVRDKDHFVSNIMRSDKVFIIGDEDELKRMVKE